MSVKQSLTICRLLVALLIFNIGAPIAVAATNSSGTTLICTTAGFIEVDIDRFYAGQTSVDQSTAKQKNNLLTHAGQHCPFCSLYEIDTTISADHLAYPKPETHLALSYQNVLPLDTSKIISKHAPLRAPPIYL